MAIEVHVIPREIRGLWHGHLLGWKSLLDI